jgi:hypothetical protein
MIGAIGFHQILSGKTIPRSAKPHRFVFFQKLLPARQRFYGKNGVRS